MPFFVREARLPADFPAIAQVISAEHGPEHPVSSEALAAEYAARDPKF